jgi:long-chain acyl-CoA synthetase
MARATILEYLDNFRRYQREEAYVFRRGYRIQRWTYGDVLRQTYRFARALESRGIGPGDKVIIWGENCAEWVVVFFGCLLRGAVVVPIDKIAAADFAARVAQQVDAKLCVASAHNAISGVPHFDLDSLRDEVAQFSDEPIVAHASRDDIVQIVFTSGTTAEPRGVVITHGNILANLEPLERQVAPYLKYERIFHPLRFLNLLPLSHVFGQFLGIFLPQLLAGTVLFQDTLNPTEVMRTIKDARVSVVVAVPRLMESLKDKIERDMASAGQSEWFRRQLEAVKDAKFPLRWWRFRKIHSQFGWKFWAFISGGAALDAETEEFWRRLSFVVIQGYGLTETTSLISLNHPFKTGKRSIGKVLEGREMKLDENGEILVRGANVAAGYWQGKELKSVLGEDGWFRTGDLGALDADGNLYFKGRKKNVIVNREGMNIYPDDLEAVLRQQPEVRDCAVVGLEQGGNAEPVAALLLRNAAADVAAIVAHANSKLAQFQQMRRWLVWPDEDFPRTSTQKPKIGVIQQAVQQKFSSAGVAAPSQGGLGELISRITGRSTGALAADAKLEGDLNLSSMDRVELMSALEDRYQVDLSEANFAQVGTVGELERLLHEPQRAQQSGYRYPRWAQSLPVRWVRNFFYYLLSLPATLIMARPTVVGHENLEGLEGPVLITCNHVTYIDVGFVLIAMPARIRNKLAVGMLGERLWSMWRPPASMNMFARWWQQAGYYLVVALFNVFPLPQQSGVRESFAFAGESVDRGYSVVVFPEGRRTEDGKPSPFRSGVGMLAQKLGIAVVPLRIDGLFDLKQSSRKLARSGELKVLIGKPLRFSPDTPAEEITSQLEHVTWSL